ncbi:hypothetical protein E1832_21830 [Antarcticimicrobium luteum]|uniref:Amidohydrolase 3 domain-containing protein n=2 Tax=Antarcticimicrobium luteum TaxID=2547397 RepID=A0A4R5UQX6_9RHOB|nr:hypothetical protein E1832_21830 [Antarcticimicrobium luteum]
MDAGRSRASAVATRGRDILFVGTAEEAAALAGPETRVIDAGGRIVLPGLHDVHIHPLHTIEPEYNGERYDCNFQGASVTMDETVARLRSCLQEADLTTDGWLVGQFFNPPSLLSVTETYPTVRAALDAVSSNIPIQLEGSDGHAFGLNTAAYRMARHPETGERLPLTADSLTGAYAAYAEYFNTDAGGAPDGTAKDFARHIIGAPVAGLENFKPVLGQLTDLMAANGITSLQDAMVGEDLADVYAYMDAEGLLDFRVRLNTHIDSNLFGGRTRPLDMQAALKAAQSMRARFSGSEYVRGDGVKLFVDGVVEHPTQTAAMLNPYLEPVFGADGDISGYVDLDGADCRQARADTRMRSGPAAAAFQAEHGFAAVRCDKRYGLLEFTPDNLSRAVTGFDKAGFTVHMHALGDKAVQVALDAVEAARRSNGLSGLPHNLAHIQFVAPEDVARIGEMGIAVTPTLAWAVPFWEYDTTVNPYINEVDSLFDMAKLYRQDGIWGSRVYPFRSIKAAGGLLAAGSDAPVDVPSPQPFVNMAAGLIRGDLLPADPRAEAQDPELVPVMVNPDEVLSLDDVLAAYTINGAIAMGQQELTGSIEPGKRADLIMIDTDIERLSQDISTIWDIAQTGVLLTVFDGRIVRDKL